MSRGRSSRVMTAVERETELALVARLRQGDADAFDDVYTAFNTRLFTFLVRLSRRRDVAEDLLEETWLRLVKHARRLRPDTRLGPWLFTVARHLYVSFNRARVLEDSVSASLIAIWPFSLEQPSPFEAVAASELERRPEPAERIRRSCRARLVRHAARASGSTITFTPVWRLLVAVLGAAYLIGAIIEAVRVYRFS